MFKKVKIKFMLIAMGSIFGILLLILSAINIYTHVRTYQRADEVITTIIQNGGGFPQYDIPFDEDIFENSDFTRKTNKDYERRDPEIPFESRFFTVRFTKTGNRYYDLSNVASVSYSTAVSYTDKVLSKNSKKGYIDYYRYGFSEDKSLLVFLDDSKGRESVRDTLIASIAYSSGGLLVFGIFLFFLSDKVIKPLKKNYESQKEFITNSSHELKTPLTVIAVNNELNEMTNGKNQYSENISHQLDKMTKMVKTMTELAKMDEINTTKLIETSIDELIENVIQNFNNVFEERHLKFTCEYNKNIVFKTDATLLSQLISIILENSSKYAKTTVNLRVFLEKSHLVIEQSNDCDNIKDGNLNFMKERFYRSPDKRVEIEGSGIGLSVADKIVSILKGTFNIEGKNNTFNIRIVLK